MPIPTTRAGRPALALAALAAAILLLPGGLRAQDRPFGLLREQAERQQQWLAERLETVVPGLMRRDRVDMWVIPMREYNEDPVFASLVSPTTFAARRRTIYVFFDRGPNRGVERLALGGTSQGGLYDARRATGTAVAGTRAQQAELWGDEQWQVLKRIIDERRPRRIAVNVSRTFAFADGLSAGEYEGMLDALGPAIARRLVRVDRLAVDLIARRLPAEEATFARLAEVTWGTIDTMFSGHVIVPGATRTSDLVWWFRQRVNDLGLGTWFQPSVSVQRQGADDAALGEDPVIQPGDVLHCDVGITALGLNTDIQHMAYVLRPGETEAPAGLRAALARSNRLQDIVREELRPGRTGNEILAASLARMRAEGLDGSIYTHPIGVHGHGAGPLIGLWDRQEGVPGRGDHRVIADSWFSIELQVTSPVPEWGGQRVRSAQEEDIILDAAGRGRWAFRRQTDFHLVRPE